MAKKSKSFNKHVYSLIAVIVLLVAAGIASYAVAPAGAASHGTLYTDIIQGKTGESVTVGNENRLLLVSAITPMPNGLININDRSDTEGSIGVKVDSSRGGTGIEVIGQEYGIKSSTQISEVGAIAVEGTNGNTGNDGKLGTATAGVEGTVDSATGFGVYGKQSAGGYAIRGENTDSGNYGELGGFIIGIKGYSVSGAGVSGRTGVIGGNGVEGLTANSNRYGGMFTGGKGLYASDISFGANAFQATANEGSLILGAAGVVACTTVCSNHGLGCLAAYTLTGTNPAYNCGVPPVGAARYCWCGSA